MVKRIIKCGNCKSLLFALSVVFIIVVSNAGAIDISNGLTSVSPNSAKPGETVSITFTLSSSVFPTPPTNKTPNSVLLGTIIGTNIVRTSGSSYITSSFTIPSDQSCTSLNAIVVFQMTNELNYMLDDGFSINMGTTKDIIYVNANSTAETPDGTSWNTALKLLQDAFEVANCYSATQIWVAAGTYYPTTDNDRTAYFELISNLTIYGGFKGNETQLSERDYVNNVTILSGDIGVAGNQTDNTYHVLVGANSAILDGFTITGGYANGAPDVDTDETLRWHRLGGGMYNENVSPTIINCTFSNNYANSGGAMYNHNYASPTISNCTFNNNSAQNGGALLARVGSDAIISDSSFSNNHADWRGGAIYIGYGANPSLSNTRFYTNTTDGNGGAVYVDDRSSQLGNTKPNITRCTFENNSATYRGGAISGYNNATYICIEDSIFTTNSAGSGGGAIACESDPIITLIGENTFTSNSGGTGDADKDNNNEDCAIVTATTCP
jgi:predicted outer membrane repeat protein